MTKLLAVVTAFILLPTCAAFADDGPVLTSAPASEKSSSKERKICRDGKPTGTRMVTRVCKTKAEWDDLYANTQRSLSNSMSRSPMEIGRQNSQKDF